MTDEPQAPTPRPGVSLSLRLFHRDAAIDATQLETTLRLRPRRTWTVGEPRTTPRGQPTGGLRKESYWYTELTPRLDVPPGNEITVLEEALVRLQPGADWLLAFGKGGGRAELYLWLLDWEVKGLTLPHDIFAKLSRIGMSLALEFT